MQTFKLIPFPAAGSPLIEIMGEVDRIKNRLSVHYSVQGSVESILLPEQAHPIRKNDLWNTTCFEFFIAVPDSSEYWEFNLSPSGEWNVYRMDAYRQVNMREEPAFCELPFAFQKEHGFSLELSVDLNPIISSAQKIQIGVAAITETKDREVTYWALAHPGEQADFHLRDSFLIEM